MRKHIIRALRSLDRLDQEKLQSLIQDMAQNGEQLEVVLSSIPGGVMVCGPDGRVAFINNPARRLLPLTTSDPTEMTAWEAIASADLSRYVRAALEEDRGAPMRDFPVRHRERSMLLSCGVLPLVDKGRIVGNMVYIEDVTAKRDEESRLKRAESLASLTTMAAGVAHEIKNPLASMSIHLQLMRRQLNGDCADPEELKESLTILEEETERLNAIVSDYLFAVRPRDSHPTDADLNALVKDLLQFVRFEAEEAGVEVVQLLDDTIPMIPLDEGAVKRALLNVVKNAIHAMPDGGTLRIQTRLENQNAVIDISDTGIGIPDELLGKIFEPYYTTRDTGTGLGLTVVYKVIREHGGDLHVDSVPGRGTTFSLSLPVPQREKKLLSGGDSEGVAR